MRPQDEAGEGRRLFFALWPDPAVRRALAAVQSAQDLRRARPTHVEDFHITLVFLGQVGDEALACVEGVAAGIAGSPFVLTLDRLDYWPRPKVLWCGPSMHPEPLAELVDNLQTGLRNCGFAPEDRPYVPHVTLARKARPSAQAPLAQPLRWAISEFVLAASEPGVPAPHYRVLSRWGLGAAPA